MLLTMSSTISVISITDAVALNPIELFLLAAIIAIVCMAWSYCVIVSNVLMQTPQTYMQIKTKIEQTHLHFQFLLGIANKIETKKKTRQTNFVKIGFSAQKLDLLFFALGLSVCLSGCLSV